MPLGRLKPHRGFVIRSANDQGEKILPLPPDRPTGWEKPKLTEHLEHLWANSIATFANKREAHRLCRIDDLLFEVASDWKGSPPNVETIVPVMMFFRAHSAFRAAAALGFGGATVEGLAVLRLCLEYAGYAALIARDPSLAEAWFDRDTDAAGKAVVRKAFTHGAIKAAIEKADPKLSSAYGELYERLIQFGAHPNEKSVTANLKIDEESQRTLLNQIYLQGDGITLNHWLRTANQIGISILKIFAIVHIARFTVLDLEPRIRELSNGL